jgi:predicted ATPase/class 3 adenylate cyclase
MLFADIEGSTLLLARLGDRYADVLDAYRSILRDAWAHWSGHEMGTEGDSFFVVFAHAADAAEAALQAQRGLSDPNRTAGERVRVRMGLHSGEPMLHGDGYVGIDVHRAARITGVAHGGQIVMSEVTSNLLPTWDEGTIELQDLGFHRLKDLAGPEHIFQLSTDGLVTDFPPLRSLGATTRLPRPATPMVGRDRELREVSTLLDDPSVRLVNLTGPGGAGKTRLALDVAAGQIGKFEDGVYFVPLSAAVKPDVVWSTIAQTLDLPADSHAPPAIFDHLASRAALFVLDNLEQVESVDAVITELLSEVQRSTVLATSRRPTHVAGEHEYPVMPLGLPTSTSVQDTHLSAAVQLFVQRAQMVRPDFRLTEANTTDITTLCARLDGMPLAIELAAARMKLLSPQAMLARIDDVLDFREAGSSRPSRHLSLRDTIRWSYDLLENHLRESFCRLGVFVGGAGLDAITAVVSERAADDMDAADLAFALLDASLVTVSDGPDGEPRVEMLGTIRAFAEERLRTAGEYDEVRRAHALHFLGLAERLYAGQHTKHAIEIRERLESEHDNLREALSWALADDTDGAERDERTNVALRLCRTLEWFWRHGGSFAEGRDYLERALERSGDRSGTDVAAALTRLSALVWNQGSHRQARALALEAVAMWRDLGDPAELSQALSTLSASESELGDLDSAQRHLEEAATVARDAADRPQLAGTLNDLSNLESDAGNFHRAIELLDEALAINEEVGDPWGVLLARYNRACNLRELGELEESHQQMCDLLPSVLAQRDVNLSVTFGEDLALGVGLLGDTDGAARLLGAVHATRGRLSLPTPVMQQALLDRHLPEIKATAPDPAGWERAYARGSGETIEHALKETVGAQPSLGYD